MGNGCDVSNKETAVLVKGITKNENANHTFRAKICDEKEVEKLNISTRQHVCDFERS